MGAEAVSVFSVWVQPVDNDITPANLDQYGSVHDVLGEYEDDEGGTPNKQFCDGQTSKTPPRYATDRMIGIYTRSREAADMISGMLREDVVRRISAGELTVVLPIWEPITRNLPVADPVFLPRLRRRAYLEFPEYAEDYIDEILTQVLAENERTLDTRLILRKVKERAGSGPK